MVNREGDLSVQDEVLMLSKEEDSLALMVNREEDLSA